MAEKTTQQTADALFLLDALQHVTSTVMINAGEIAAQKDAKVNTIQKRFTTLKQRYNLNIQTTAVGGTTAATTPTKTKAAKVTKTPTPKKTATKKTNAAKAGAIFEQLEGPDGSRAKAFGFKRSEDEEKEETGNIETQDGMNSNGVEGDSDRV